MGTELLAGPMIHAAARSKTARQHDLLPDATLAPTAVTPADTNFVHSSVILRVDSNECTKMAAIQRFSTPSLYIRPVKRSGRATSGQFWTWRRCACRIHAPYYLLPRGLRPLATEDACRTDQMVTLILAFTAYVAPHTADDVEQFHRREGQQCRRRPTKQVVRYHRLSSEERHAGSEGEQLGNHLRSAEGLRWQAVEDRAAA